jgi:hypothetical protein
MAEMQYLVDDSYGVLIYSKLILHFLPFFLSMSFFLSAVVPRDPALRRIATVGAAVVGLACAGFIGLAVSTVDQALHRTSTYGI